MARWMSVGVVLAASLAAWGADPGGDVMIPVSAWDVRTSEERYQFVAEWESQCRARGHNGSVRIWADDGRTLLATREPGRPIELVRNVTPTIYRTAGGYLGESAGEADTARGLVLIVILVVAACLACTLAVMLVRWILRVNRIVKLQEELVEEVRALRRSERI